MLHKSVEFISHIHPGYSLHRTFGKVKQNLGGDCSLTVTYANLLIPFILLQYASYVFCAWSLKILSNKLKNLLYITFKQTN